MTHLPLNSSIRIPVEVILLDGYTPRTGEAGDLSVQLVSVEDGARLDSVDGQFRASPSSPNYSMTARSSPNAHVYYHHFTPTSYFRRGYYRAQVSHAQTGESWSMDFTLGLMVNRDLGVTATYDGSALNIGAWVEENGVLQTDYQSMSSGILLDYTGSPLTGGGVLFTSGSNGVFHASKTIAISAGTPLILQATASVARHGGTYQFPLRSEMIRP